MKRTMRRRQVHKRYRGELNRLGRRGAKMLSLAIARYLASGSLLTHYPQLGRPL